MALYLLQELREKTEEYFSSIEHTHNSNPFYRDSTPLITKSDFSISITTSRINYFAECYGYLYNISGLCEDVLIDEATGHVDFDNYFHKTPIYCYNDCDDEFEEIGIAYIKGGQLYITITKIVYGAKASFSISGFYGNAVPKVPTQLTLGYSNNILDGDLTSALGNGYPMADTIIHITFYDINDDSWSQTIETDSNGHFSVECEDNLKSYTVTYNGDEQFESSTITVDLTEASTIGTQFVDLSYNTNNRTLTGYLKTEINEDPIPNAAIYGDFSKTENGSWYMPFNTETDSNGLFSVTCTANGTPDEYTVTYDGDATYDSSTTTVNINNQNTSNKVQTSITNIHIQDGNKIDGTLLYRRFDGTYESWAPMNNATLTAHIYDGGEIDETETASIINSGGGFSFRNFDLEEILDISQNTGNLSNLYCDISYAGDSTYDGCLEHCQMTQMSL